MSQASAAMYPVGKMSVRNNTCSSLRPFSILSGPTSAYGTRTYSACPPANPPNKCEYPNSPAGECPHIFSAIQALGLEFSHNENIVRWQKKHFPQEMLKGTITRSPTLSFFTLLPTSTTSPMNSWPRTSPCCIEGTK